MKFDFPDFSAPVDSQFRNWMIESCGAIDPPFVIPNGEIFRFRDGKHKGTPAWCVLYPSGVGLYANFADGHPEPYKFFPKFSRDLTIEERKVFDEECRQRMEQFKTDRVNRQSSVAAECRKRFEDLPEATDDNPYCLKKGIRAPHGCKADGDLLVVPFRNAEGDIVTLQTITGEGFKQFAKDGQASGVYFQIGENPSYLCEGIATGESIHEATGKGVVCCAMASNLPKVAKIFTDCMVIADRDKNGTGEKYARESGLPFFVIPDVSEDCTDANDFAQIRGIKALSSWISKECRRPSIFIRGDELLEDDEDPQDWLIKRIIPSGQSLSCVYGRGASGKTFFVLSQMLAIVTGQADWCGYRVKQGRVAYLNAESPRGFKNRVRFWCQEHGGIEANRKMIHENLLVSQGITKHLNTPEDLEIIQRDIKAANFKPDVIVIDTVNRYMIGNENSTEDVSAFIRGCDTLKAIFNCAVVFVHHVGLSEDAQKRVRGSSVFQASCDFMLRLDERGNGVLAVIQTKNKEAENEPEFFMEFVKGTIEGWFDADGDQIESSYLSPCARPEETKSEKQRDDETLVREAFRAYGYIDGNGDVILDIENLKKFLIRYFRMLPLKTKSGEIASERQILKRVGAEINPKQKKLLDRIMRYNFASVIYDSGNDLDEGQEGEKPKSLVMVNSGEIIGVKAYLRMQSDLPNMDQPESGGY